MTKYRTTFAAGLTMAICVANFSMVSAQTASSVTPDTFQPPLQKLDGSIAFTGEAGTAAPPGSEAIGITLSGVSVEGGLPALSEAEAAFRARLTSGRIAVSELFEATAGLEKAYANAGFVLTRVVLPQQSLRDGGVLRVAVVNGFVEAVDDATVPEPVRDRLAQLTVPLVDQAGIRLEALERQLLLAGDAPGVALNSALAAGQRSGGTVLALDAQHRLLTGFVGVDNLASADLGVPVLSFGLELNSAFQKGETIYGRLTASPYDVLTDDPRYRVAALGVSLPAGASGLTLNAEATQSLSHPESDVVETRSTFERYALRMIYPYIRSRDMNLSVQMSLNHLTDEQSVVGPTSSVLIYSDTISVLRAGASGSRQHGEDARTEGSITLSRGLDVNGASANGAVPLSRQGADPVFSKLNAGFRHQRAMGDAMSFSISGRVQTAFGDALVTSEQFGIVGPGDLSSFDSGALRGDSGYVARAELSKSYETTVFGRGAVVAPYAFAGFGQVNIAQPTALENASTQATSFGIGADVLVQGDTPFRADTVRIEFGKGSHDSGEDQTRFGISANFRF